MQVDVRQGRGIFAEVNSTDAKRDAVRQQWLDVARRIEDALSS